MKYLQILGILLYTIPLYAQSYSGQIEYGNASLSYQIKLVETDGFSSAHFSSLAMNAYEIPCQHTTLKNDSLHFYVMSDNYTYEYKYDKQNNDFKGKLMIYANESEKLLSTFSTDLILKVETVSQAMSRQELSFVSNGLQLFGTLWQPQNPIQKGILFVTSSQGNDRSATYAEASYYTSLGYSVFCYDKRGTGKSEGNWQSANIETLCSDDMNALKFFAKTTLLPLSEIGIKGSSQGGIKIPYIMAKVPELKFGISVSSPGGTLLESDLNHWKTTNTDLIGRKNIDIATIAQRAGYEYLAGIISFKKVTAVKNKYNDQDWYKYIWVPEENNPKDSKLNFSGLPYFKKIHQPILVIQGLSDEVIPANSYRIIAKALKKSKSTKYEILTLENTTHSMTLLDKEYPYFQTLSPKYLPSITEWLHQLDHE